MNARFRCLLAGMFFGVVLGRLLGVVRRVVPVAGSHFRMMGSFLVVALFVVLRGFQMVLGRMLVMFRGFLVMFNAFVIGMTWLSSGD